MGHHQSEGGIGDEEFHVLSSRPVLGSPRYACCWIRGCRRRSAVRKKLMRRWAREDPQTIQGSHVQCRHARAVNCGNRLISLSARSRRPSDSGSKHIPMFGSDICYAGRLRGSRPGLVLNMGQRAAASLTGARATDASHVTRWNKLNCRQSDTLRDVLSVSAVSAYLHHCLVSQRRINGDVRCLWQGQQYGRSERAEFLNAVGLG